jgi:hypothetical protein
MEDVTPSDSEKAHSSNSSDYDESSKMLKECFQMVGDSFGAPIDAPRDPPTRPWRPINPIVGASVEWRRIENAHWRLFFTAQAQRRAAEAAEERLYASMPNTPSSFGCPRDVPLTCDHYDLERDGSGSIGASFDEFDGACCSSPTLPMPIPKAEEPCTLYQLASRNSALEQRVAHLERREILQLSRQNAKLEQQVGLEKAETQLLHARITKLEQLGEEKDAIIRELQLRAEELETALKCS